MKKLLALILAMSMALSCLCGGALAAEVEEEPSAPAAEVTTAEETESAPAAPEESEEQSEEEPEADPEDGEESAQADEAEADPELSEEEPESDADAAPAESPSEADADEEPSESQADADAQPGDSQAEVDSLSAQSEEYVYALMNIPYGAFYKAEGVDNQVDAVSSATKNKTRTGSLAAGSYHVNSDGTDITGVIFPVKVKQSDLTGCTQITDQSSVTISVTNRGNTTETTYSGKDALFEAPSCAYYSLGSTLPGDYTAYKEATLTNGVWSFGAVQGAAVQNVSNASAAVDPAGHHTDVEILVSGPTLANESVSGAIVTTSEGKSYGLRHVTEIWRNGYSIGWNYNQPGFGELTGKTITGLTYITQKAVYSMAVNVRVPEYVYALMNIPYGAFYKAELAENSVDVVSSATASKSRNKGLAGGSYHEAASQGIDGVVYPVKVDKASLAGLTQVTDDTSVTMTYNNRGTQMTDTLTGQAALMEAPSYAYYLLSDTPVRSKAATLTNGVWSFGKVSGRSTPSTAELTITTGGHHTYYEFDGPDVLAEGEVLCGAVLTTTGGQTYGLRHVTEIWRNGLQLGWDEADGYEGLSGKTIKTIKYFTRDNVYEVSTNLYVPVNSGAVLSVENAAVDSGMAAVTLNAPDDFQPVYAVLGLDGAAVSNGKLSFTAPAAPGSYTMTVTDTSGKYAPVSASFVLTTTAQPAAYDSASKSLKAASGTAAADFTAYLGKISKVTVDGTDYNATGRGAVKLIDTATGTIDTAAAPFAEKKAYSVVVTAVGYSNDLRFTLDLSPAQPKPQPQQQTITAANVTKVFGSAPFSLGAKAQTKLSYSSSNKKVVTVNGSGLVTIQGAGSAKITITAAATDRWKAATKTITVTITKASQTVTAKDVTKVFGSKAFSLGASAQTALSYSSSNKKVVTVNGSGLVTIKGAGRAQITITAAATDRYQTVAKTITVVVSKAKQPLTVTPAKKALKLNKKNPQTVTLKAAKAQGKLTWTSSNKKVKVKNGKVTIPKGFKGSVKITASANGNKNYAAGKKVVTIQVK